LFGERLLKLVKILEGTIDNGVIREVPKQFSRLKFRGIGWEQKRLESGGKGQVFTGVPGSLVKD
jgi:hypothetical protein